MVDEPEPNLALSPVEIQQQYFESLPEYDWVKYEHDNRNSLVQNIAFALFGSPTEIGELHPANDEEVQLQGYTTRQRERVLNIFGKLIEQGKYSRNKEDIYMSVLLVVCVTPRTPVAFYKAEPPGYWDNLHDSSNVNAWCTAVFRVRKCIPNDENVKVPCRLYIDEEARVYQDWQSYLDNNTQPKCILVVPQDGEYTGTLTKEQDAPVAVRLSVVPSAALGVRARVLSAADRATSVMAVGALGAAGASLLLPTAAVAGAAVATVTAVTGVYGMLRSGMHLRDRKMHQQSIHVCEAEARNSWLNIAASGVGVAAGASATLLARSAAAGSNLTTTGVILTKSVDVLARANLLTGGVGLANSLYFMIVKVKKHGERPSSLELFQFTASTLFFFGAAMSNRTAKAIIEESQTNVINNYRETLRSNRHRKIFDKVSAETRRISGELYGKTEVVRGIKYIDNKDQFFADILNINKDVNKHNVRISLTSDGNVKLNALHKFDPRQLLDMGPSGRTELFTNLGSADTSVRNAATKLATSPSLRAFATDEENNGCIVNIRPGQVLRLGTLLLRVTTSGAEDVAHLLSTITSDAHNTIMTLSLTLLSRLVPEQVAKLKLLSPDKDIIVQTVEFIFNYVKTERPLGEVCVRSDNGIAVLLKEFLHDGSVRPDTFLILRERFVDWIRSESDRLDNRYGQREPVRCTACRGIRFSD